MTGFLEGMKQRSCDVRVFHLDCFWMKQYEWYAIYTDSGYKIGNIHENRNRCSFTFDPDNFPDPAKYLSEIKNKYNVKICLWSELNNAIPFLSRLT